MVGFIIVTHNRIGTEMLKTVLEITKDKPGIISVETSNDAPFSETQQAIFDAITRLREYNGIVILTDLFGATPCNLCTEFLKENKVEMVTGCNLPMLIKAAATDFKESASDVARFLKEYGKDNIRTYPEEY